MIAVKNKKALEADVRYVTDKRKVLGQVFTPKVVAEFMSSFFYDQWAHVDLLDAGAGTGALTMALVHRLCNEQKKPKYIHVIAYEIDSHIIPKLTGSLNLCRRICAESGISFTAEVRSTDFIEDAVNALNGQGMTSPTRFNAAIVNPPYKKINSDSKTRLLLRSLGIETSNLYTAFLAIIIRLLKENGELVAITPRSFCNGPYFKPFRIDFLKEMSLRRIHVYESRAAAFKESEVLQENIIYHAVKKKIAPEKVIISSSLGAPGAVVTKHKVNYDEVISPHDPERFIHLVLDDLNIKAKSQMEKLTATLSNLGLSVSTGRVVDFRAEKYLRRNPGAKTVPLIYPCHFNGGYIHWPKIDSRKPNAIIDNKNTRSLLVPAGNYVLVKRFSSKEETRRVVSCIYDPDRINAPYVGFENHLNYFHVRGGSIPLRLAKGLAAFLRSTIVDTYFRQFSGHTQVNATDLRNMKYPSKSVLEHLGDLSDQTAWEQAAIDELVESEVF